MISPTCEIYSNPNYDFTIKNGISIACTFFFLQQWVEVGVALRDMVSSILIEPGVLRAAKFWISRGPQSDAEKCHHLKLGCDC